MNPPPQYTFKKEERLKKRKDIEQLFSKGKSFQVYPLRWVWAAVPKEKAGNYPIQMAVSVSKKRFKLAVDRNRVKRLMKEAWRLNKHTLYAQLKTEEHYSLMLIYTSKEEQSLAQLEKHIQKGIKLFLKRRFQSQKPRK